MEKRLLFQVEGDYQSKVLNELYMTARYTKNPAQRNAAEDLGALDRLVRSNGYLPVEAQSCDPILMNINIPGENSFTRTMRGVGYCLRAIGITLYQIPCPFAWQQWLGCILLWCAGFAGFQYP